MAIKVAVLGSGYVGLVTAAVFADLGNQVIGVDIDAERVKRLCQGESPIYEPGLAPMLTTNLAEGRLSFTTDTTAAVRASNVVFIAVGTPPSADGSTDLSQVDAAARAIAMAAQGHVVVVNKSTVPVGTGARVHRILHEHVAPGTTFTVISNPEFLREGTALTDALHPDRVLIGTASPEAAEPLLALYAPLGCPILLTDVPSAEMIKYASNAFLATKLSFINMLADLCEQVGADVRLVAKGIGADPRIGASFLNAGIGYGGSCLPKDVDSLIAVCHEQGIHPTFLDAVRAVNQSRVPHVVDRLRDALGGLEGRTIAVWGLTFKPDTDDLRESRALDLCRQLLTAGAGVRAHDPMALEAAQPLLAGVTCCANALDAATGADAVVLATEWTEYLQSDLAAARGVMRGTLFVDGRNALPPAEVERAGFRYLGIGHGAPAVFADPVG